VFQISVGNRNRNRNFLMSNFLQLNLDLQNNSKNKVEKAFFFIFMSFYAEMSLQDPKKRKSH
jgi:hypothetical protein